MGRVYKFLVMSLTRGEHDRWEGTYVAVNRQKPGREGDNAELKLISTINQSKEMYEGKAFSPTNNDTTLKLNDNFGSVDSLTHFSTSKLIDLK